MSKKLRVLVCSILVLSFAFLVHTAEAYDHGKKKGCKQGFEGKVCKKAYFLLKNEDELDLTDEQVKKIKDLKIAVKKDLITRKAELDLIKIDIQTMLHEDKVNLEEINKLIDKKYDLKKAKSKYLIETYTTLKNTLTEEQKKELKKLWKKCDKK